MLGQPTSMTCWVTMIAVIGAVAWIYEVRVRIHPNYFQIFEAGIQTMESGTSNWMISPYSHHNTVFVSFHSFHNWIIDFSQEWIK